ncbi:MAG: hypothetical protein RI564_00320 [Gracilimonas sp.]|nr:hypothetical protein [Gracilimonas sp.]
METIKVDILDPKARKLLKDLVDSNMIAIRPSSKKDLIAVLKRLRSKSASAPTTEEIAKEVEEVRSRRYSK